MFQKKDEKWLPWYWAGVEKVIKDGGTPSRAALKIALNGSEPIPATVRDFLAKCIEYGFPSNRPTETIWERELKRSWDWRGDAAWEYAYRWTCCRICKLHAKKMSISEAIIAVSERNIKSKNSIFHEFVRPELDQLYAIFLENGPYSPSVASMKKQDEIIADIAGRNDENVRSLRRRITESPYRKSKV
ncbi:MAG: hypothetical protein JJ973_00780 [Rhodospirillales bacterium]|nr:hypothetical protein [Rhodospirillales bacterium]